MRLGARVGGDSLGTKVGGGQVIEWPAAGNVVNRSPDDVVGIRSVVDVCLVERLLRRLQLLLVLRRL